MSYFGKIRYNFMRNFGAPAMMRFSNFKKKKRKPNPNFNSPLESGKNLKEMMTRHYLLARYAKGAMPVAWVSSGAPVELLRPFGFYTIYPENHGALCGAKKMGPQICTEAENCGFSQDICSYARIDIGYFLSGKTPVGKLPKPDILFCSNNICQTITYWFRVLSEHLKIPLILFDTPYNSEEITQTEISYMTQQFDEMIPILEKISGVKFDFTKFQNTIKIAKETSKIWGEILDTMRNQPAPMTIFDAFGHLASVVSLRGLPVTLNYYKTLLDELQNRVKNGIGATKNEQKRLMWDNIAIWYKVREHANYFAEKGMNFVAATYPSAWAETAHFMDSEKPFESLAHVYSSIILNNNLKYRLELMSNLIRDFQIDGLVIHSAKSCKPYSVGQYDLKRLLRENLNIPSVIIDADITDSRAYSEEQTRTRLDAFCESLEEK